MKYSPISGRERIIPIDIIRGFALFGIFLVNMPAFHTPVFMKTINGVPMEYSGVDYWVDVFFSLFVEMKFFTIFSFLFGLGFFIFMSRAEQKGLAIKHLYLRRIFALFLFGLLHLIGIWFGDILHTYAIAGLFLLFFYKRKIKTILIWACSLLVVINTLFSLSLFAPDEAIVEMRETSSELLNWDLKEYVNIYENAGYFEWVSYRVSTEVVAMMTNLVPSLIPVMAMFLFGLAAGKAGIFRDIPSHLSFLRKIRFITFLISLPLVLVLALFKVEIFDIGVKQIYVIQVFKSLTGTSLCFFYLSSLALLLRKEKWQKRLRPLGYTGQMALTNYLSQSIISIIFFVGFGFYGEVSLLTGTVLCLLIYGAQIAFSSFWLWKYRFGPFEWLWRSFTYVKFQPMWRENKEERATNHPSS